LLLSSPVPVSELPGFYTGAVSVQDAAAQLAAILLNPQQGERVLDACAAPGGKTAHLLELAHCEMVALELDGARLSKISGNLDRLRLHSDEVRVLRGDASKTSWWDGCPFDKILLDAPCSASGIVARHPDIPFLRREADIKSLQQKQREILEEFGCDPDKPHKMIDLQLTQERIERADAEAKKRQDAWLHRQEERNLQAKLAAVVATSIFLLYLWLWFLFVNQLGKR
jgi:predicted RNA methylase